MDTTPTDELLSIGAAARLLGVSVETLRAWESAGNLAAIRTPGGQRRFRRSQITALMPK